jgi:hypothetical protein
MRKEVLALLTYGEYPGGRSHDCTLSFMPIFQRAAMIQDLVDRSEQQRALGTLAQQRTKSANVVLIVRAD